ncbi:MAG: helix-turn-helix domain-containing protein [Haloferacaceae archaeon]
MPQAKLTVAVPERVWVYDLSVTNPETAFRVMTTLAGEQSGVALVELVTEDPVPLLAEMSDRREIQSVELLWKRDDVALVQVETANPLLLLPIMRAGVPLETPFEIRDGEATWTLSTTGGRLSTLGDHLDDLGIDFRIEYVRSFGTQETDTLLTDRQREVFLVALDRGYYDTPRDATLTELAGDLGVAKATASDILHRAEGKVLGWFAETHLRDA